jgi:hypothetical protein
MAENEGEKALAGHPAPEGSGAVPVFEGVHLLK